MTGYSQVTKRSCVLSFDHTELSLSLQLHFVSLEHARLSHKRRLSFLNIYSSKKTSDSPALKIGQQPLWESLALSDKAKNSSADLRSCKQLIHRSPACHVMASGAVSSSFGCPRILGVASLDASDHFRYSQEDATLKCQCYFCLKQKVCRDYSREMQTMLFIRS